MDYVYVFIFAWTERNLYIFEGQNFILYKYIPLKDNKDIAIYKYKLMKCV